MTRKEKEKRIRDYEKKVLIEELSKMPYRVISLAYLHALNYTTYGVDVTEKWITATQQADALARSYRAGYHDALQNSERMLDKPSEKEEEQNG